MGREVRRQRLLLLLEILCTFVEVCIFEVLVLIQLVSVVMLLMPPQPCTCDILTLSLFYHFLMIFVSIKHLLKIFNARVYPSLVEWFMRKREGRFFL